MTRPMQSVHPAPLSRHSRSLGMPGHASSGEAAPPLLRSVPLVSFVFARRFRINSRWPARYFSGFRARHFAFRDFSALGDVAPSLGDALGDTNALPGVTTSASFPRHRWTFPPNSA